jgi:DnaK suppressor protein
MFDTTAIKATLEQELIRVRTDLETIAIRNEETGDFEALPDTSEQSEADPNSEADGVETWNERRATVSSLETLYRNIERALLKLSDGSYGICEICQSQIEEARLAAIATARTCIAHKDDERTLPL